ncbi:MAG TPA: cytochrome d ubiquinol oxidase subunit II [Candidatus Dormibacteraeota bacterium]|nr:cytochrome d ubiquinol oxidase subunit II [Candidatus Dormibacteraeota bacterium]
MSEAGIIAAVLWLALTAYAVLAGADFGGGVWDLFASGPRAREQRQAVATAMGPVWEANHVWLIFMITGLFTAFPSAFGVLSLDLYVPFTIALVGIVLRGAAFAFRAHGREAVGGASTWGVAFGTASIIAPFFLATGIGAVAVGLTSSSWAAPYSFLIGCFAVSMCAYLAATYLMVETEATPLESDFRQKAAIAGVVAGVLAVICLGLAPLAAPNLAHALLGRGLPLALLALINGLVALAAVSRSRPRIARVAVAGQVVLVLWAWAVGQWPSLIPPTVTIDAAAAPSSTLDALLVVIGVGMLALIPSLAILFRVFKARNPAAID